MSDLVAKEVRSRNMAAIKGKNTKLEIEVRKAIHAAGLRFRLHRRDLPGNPDIVLPRIRVVIMVNGCFWHGHTCKEGSRTPGSNADYWVPKIQRTRERDKLAKESLESLKWTVFVIWNCEMPMALEKLVSELLMMRDSNDRDKSVT